MTRKKGYVFLDIQQNEDPKKIASRILDKFLDKKIDYSCAVVGKYSVVIEKYIEELADVDQLLSRIRQDEKICPAIVKATTFIGLSQG